MFENIPREKVLDVVKAKGPLIPVKIVKELGGNTFIIGAVLSDLMSSKLVKATLALRVGATPVYYVQGQEEKLLDFIQYLNEKDRRTLNLLKEQKVMMDKLQDPLTRVCLQNLKDFTFPFTLNTGGEKLLFWRYYLITEADAINMANDITTHIKVTPTPELQKPSITTPTQTHTQTTPLSSIPNTSVTKQSSSVTTPHLNAKTPFPLKQENPQVQPTNETQRDVKEFITSKPKLDTFEQTVKQKESELAQAGEAPINLPTPQPGSFAEKVFRFLTGKGIIIQEVLLVKKGEVTLIVSVPSPVGTITQYCKARDKKNISDGDLATATLEGQNKGFPILFLTTGALSKKAEKMRHGGAKNFSYVKI